MATNPSQIGLVSLVTLAGTNKQKVAQIKALIPNPDQTAGRGATAGGGFLDEMSPAAAAQLLVELTALETSIVNAA